MPKPTIETFNYDKWYSLFDLAKIFNCEWHNVPEYANGIISIMQAVQVNSEGVEEYHCDEFTSIEWEGHATGVHFVCNDDYMSVDDRIFKIIPNELILNIEGI